jgi:hypothetical protein
MHRYFLHTEYFGHLPTADDDGAMFASVEAAVREACLGLREMVCSAINDESCPIPKKITILDIFGAEVGSMNAMEAVPLQLRMA